MRPVVINPKRRGYVRVSQELITDLLRLKPGVKVDAVIQDVSDFLGDRFTIVVRGDGLPATAEVTELEEAVPLKPEDVFLP